MLLAQKLLLEDLWPLITIPSHSSNPTNIYHWRRPLMNSHQVWSLTSTPYHMSHDCCHSSIQIASSNSRIFSSVFEPVYHILGLPSFRWSLRVPGNPKKIPFKGGGALEIAILTENWAKIWFSPNFGLRGPNYLRSTFLNYILDDIFRDTPLDHIWHNQRNTQIGPNMAK